MECVYRHLVRLHREAKLDFSLCSTFNLDEYVGLFPSDPNSYRHYMDHHSVPPRKHRPRNTHLPNGLANDLDAECRHYEALIQRFGGIDLQLLGIGKAGHIGFNEPLSALRSRTRVKALTPTTIKQNAPFFGGEDKMPRRAITMGVGTILEAAAASCWPRATARRTSSPRQWKARSPAWSRPARCNCTRAAP